MPLFSRVAISLSGGGFRASAYHLGTLSYLNCLKIGDTNLLEQVKVLSTNSGGTITGLIYAQHMATGKTFDDFYQKIFSILHEDQLFDKAFSNIRKTGTWSSKTKRHNLINAFAEYYHQEVFDKACFDIFLKPSGHLESVIFNATEFNHGLPFRFQNNGKFGNRYIDLPLKIKSGIRLGDILAASSCFPGGFEPLKMPDDFGSIPSDEIHQYWEKQKKEPVAIMDGGIVDNQGVNSIVLEEMRSKEDISTFIISDVQQKPGAFVFPDETAAGGLRNLHVSQIFSAIHWTMFISLFLTLGTAASLLVVKLSYQKIVIILFLGLFSSIFSISVIANIVKNKLVKSISGILDKMVGKKETSFWENINFVLKIPVRMIFDLLNQRKTSFIKIVSDIFMNRISAIQVQDILFDDRWRGRSLHSKIGFLLEESRSKTKIKTKLETVIQQAGAMPTTLWFRDDQKEDQILEKLIACGQATLNYTLTEYIDAYRTDNHQSITEEESRALGVLYLKLHEDWEKFNDNPLWMVEQMKQKGQY